MKYLSLIAALVGISASKLYADTRILAMKGKVQIFEKGKWTKATVASKITVDTSLQVGYQSNATIAFSDGSQIQLRPNTTISFNKLSNTGKRQGSEIFIEQGSLSAFVKKPEDGFRNEFRIRTPTKVAGVRGSFMGFSKRGKEHRVSAIQSGAFIKEESLPTTTREKLQKAHADLERSELQMRDTLAEMKELSKAVLSVPTDKKTIEWLAELKDHKSLQAALLEQQTLLAHISKETGREADTKAAIERILALTSEQLRWARAAYEAEFEAALIESRAREKEEKFKEEKADSETVNVDTTGEYNIPEGDTITWEDTLSGPREYKVLSSRAKRYTGSGLTEAETQFLQQGQGANDTQAGAGNDSQNINNSVNSVTQPSTTTLPTLTKF